MSTQTSAERVAKAKAALKAGFSNKALDAIIMAVNNTEAELATRQLHEKDRE